MWWQIGLTFMIIAYISVIMDFIVYLWQAMPLREEKSTPIYITKDIW